MYRYSIPACLLAAVMVALLIPTPALAASLELKPSIGDVYVVTTIKGVAKKYVGGQETTLQAVLEMKCRVTEAGARFVLFRVVEGTLKIGDDTYKIVDDRWRGIYDRKTEKTFVEATAVDGFGARIHFILIGDDSRHTPGGTYMNIGGGLKDPGGDHWRLTIRAWRFRVN